MIGAWRWNNVEVFMKYVQTNIGKIPLDDYLDLQSQQYGYDDYKDLQSNGLSLDIPETIDVEEPEL